MVSSQVHTHLCHFPTIRESRQHLSQLTFLTMEHAIYLFLSTLELKQRNSSTFDSPTRVAIVGGLIRGFYSLLRLLICSVPSGGR